MADFLGKMGEKMRRASAWGGGQGPYHERLQALNSRENELAARTDGVRRLLAAQRLLANGDITGAQGVFLEGAKQFEGTRAGEAMQKAAMLEGRALPVFVMNELADLRATGVLKTEQQSGPKFSAMTRVLPGGLVLQADDRGGITLTGPDGQVIEDPEMKQKALSAAMELEATHAQNVAQGKALGAAEGAGEGQRAQRTIDEGLLAAKGMPVLRRTRDLLEKVKTGGPNKWAMEIKQFFGVEGADEAELSANLGRAVLSQLRQVFGAQFTEREGARLERIEAAFGKSTAGNIRLINQLVTLAEHEATTAIEFATARGDQATVQQIDAYLNMDMSPDGEDDEFSKLWGRSP